MALLIFLSLDKFLLLDNPSFLFSIFLSSRIFEVEQFFKKSFSKVISCKLDYCKQLLLPAIENLGEFS